MARPLLAALALLGASCSFTTFNYDQCELNSDCREAFGWGSECVEGLCAEVEASPRCKETWPQNLWSNREASKDAIPVGINFDLSQFSAEAQAAMLAVIQVDEYEGIDGTSFVVIECTNEENGDLDNLTQDEANLEVTEYLANRIGAPAIVGPATSARTEASYGVASTFGTLIMTPSATSPALTSLDGLTCSDQDPGLLWRTAPPDDLQGKAMAQYLEAEGHNNVAVLYYEDSYGQGLAESFTAVFTGTAELLPFNKDAERDDVAVTAFYGDYDEVIFISADKDDILAFLYTAIALDPSLTYERDPPVGIFLADGAYDLTIFEDVVGDDDPSTQAVFALIRGTRPTTVQDTNLQFLIETFDAAYRAAFDGDDPNGAGFTTYSFDGAWLALYGAAWSQYQTGSVSGLGIGQGLRKVSSGSEVQIRATNWSTVKASFEEGQGIDVIGASGYLDFDPTSCETSAPIEVWALKYVSSSGFDWEFETKQVIEF